MIQSLLILKEFPESIRFGAEADIQTICRFVRTFLFGGKNHDFFLNRAFKNVAQKKSPYYTEKNVCADFRHSFSGETPVITG